MRGFRAYNSGAAQVGIPNNQYAKPVFGTLAYNFNTEYDLATDTWTPVPVGGCAALVRICGQIWIVGGAGYSPLIANAGLVAKVYKNGGADVFTGIGQSNPDLPGTAVIQFSGQDLAQPGDTYNLELYATANPSVNIPFPSTAANTVKLDNNMAHHWWAGDVAP